MIQKSMVLKAILDTVVTEGSWFPHSVNSVVVSKPVWSLVLESKVVDPKVNEDTVTPDR